MGHAASPQKSRREHEHPQSGRKSGFTALCSVFSMDAGKRDESRWQWANTEPGFPISDRIAPSPSHRPSTGLGIIKASFTINIVIPRRLIFLISRQQPDSISPWFKQRFLLSRTR